MPSSRHSLSSRFKNLTTKKRDAHDGGSGHDDDDAAATTTTPSRSSITLDDGSAALGTSRRSRRNSATLDDGSAILGTSRRSRRNSTTEEDGPAVPGPSNSRRSARNSNAFENGSAVPSYSSRPATAPGQQPSNAYSSHMSGADLPYNQPLPPLPRKPLGSQPAYNESPVPSKSPGRSSGRKSSGSSRGPASNNTGIPSVEEVVRRSKYNSADTVVEEVWHPAVVHETIKPHVHHITHKVVHREIHDHDVMHRIQPVVDVEMLPARHFVQDGEQLREVEARDIPGRVDNAEIQEVFMRAAGESFRGEVKREDVEPSAVSSGSRTLR